MLNQTVYIMISGTPACVNTTEYWCLEGVKMYYSYVPCYHEGMLCMFGLWGGSIIPWFSALAVNAVLL
jgi:hypothetical protein